ncbi:MAG: ornithine cyclodeaminase family protein [Gemmatimonadota bacterium]
MTHHPTGGFPAGSSSTLVLRRGEVARLLRMAECVDAVERAFLAHALGRAIPPAMLGVHVDGGGFHVKAAGLFAGADGRPVFASKINANFPGNPERSGLPTIQGVIALFDAADGRLLALLDSIEITILRTAAATAVAAKYLARETAVVVICGCGEQARSQLRALACVRTLERVMAFDLNAERAVRFAADMTSELGVDVAVIDSLDGDARTATIWITCTPARHWFLGRAHVAPGAFVAAVGADNPDKQEIEPELLAASVVVADILEQSATIGDLHHALNSGVMQREAVRAELGEIVAGKKPGRLAADEIIVFDSTGTALQDVALAALVYERALATGVGRAIALGSLDA